MQSLFAFLLALAILIAIHEFGHFWVARRCGVKVLKFSIGFGKPLWQKIARDGTHYVVAMIPLGGYVKMLDEREGEVPADQINAAFNRKPLRSRVAIVAAGPIANLLFAIFAYWLVFIIGIAGIKPVINEVVADSPAEIAQLLPGDQIERINGDKTPTWSSVRNALTQIADKGGTAELTIVSEAGQQQRKLEVAQHSILSDKPISLLKQLGVTPVLYDLKPVIGTVVPNKPAQLAGLQTGDLVISTNDQAITHWAEWVEIVKANPNQLLNVEIERQGQQLILQLTPSKTDEGIGVIGVGVDASATPVPDALKAELRYGLFTGLVKAAETTWQMSSLTVRSFISMLSGELSTKNLGGPISIAQFAGASADRGLTAFFSFLAMISISLGILNLLPIPILDGGHLMMYFFEWVRGKPLSEQTQLKGQKIGLILLLALMLFAFFNDLSRLFGL